MIKQQYAYYLSHTGLGDNITSISAIKFLLTYYETIYFIGKIIYSFANAALKFYKWFFLFCHILINKLIMSRERDLNS